MNNCSRLIHNLFTSHKSPSNDEREENSPVLAAQRRLGKESFHQSILTERVLLNPVAFCPEP